MFPPRHRCAQRVSVSTSSLLIVSLSKLVRRISIVNLKLFLNLSGIWPLRQQDAPRANVIAGSTSEACRGLFNYLRRSNAALSDNSIQTTVEGVPPLFPSARSDRIIFGCHRSVTDIQRGLWPTF
jgi:hypothetical protein